MENNFADKIKRKKRRRMVVAGLLVVIAAVILWSLDFETAGEAVKKAKEAVVGTDTVTVSIEIRCDTLANDLSRLKDERKAAYIPEDGVILKKTEFEMEKGSTVFDLLKKATMANDIQVEYAYTQLYDAYYVEGINHLYEFDGGRLSGWQYYVNGQYPQYGCSQYTLEEKNSVLWVYTCDNGKDIHL